MIVLIYRINKNKIVKIWLDIFLPILLVFQESHIFTENGFENKELVSTFDKNPKITYTWSEVNVFADAKEVSKTLNLKRFCRGGIKKEDKRKHILKNGRL